MLRLKEVLNEVGKSQKWLSDQLGISKNAVNGLVNESSKPSLKRLYEIANILDVSIYDLLEPNKEVTATSNDNALHDEIRALQTKISTLENKIDRQTKILLQLGYAEYNELGEVNQSQQEHTSTTETPIAIHSDNFTKLSDVRNVLGTYIPAIERYAALKLNRNDLTDYDLQKLMPFTKNEISSIFISDLLRNNKIDENDNWTTIIDKIISNINQ